MSSVAAVNHEILPGYFVTDRIGSGGYGEVSRVVAAGGVEEAVKTLYGYHDEALAALELKALERIKSVRHPFLIAIDRFEIVDGKLVVITELAEQSLAERFQECRRLGLPGIPRGELLGYLGDAADALDYMHQHHGLQHLDWTTSVAATTAGAGRRGNGSNERSGRCAAGVAPLSFGPWSPAAACDRPRWSGNGRPGGTSADPR